VRNIDVFYKVSSLDVVLACFMFTAAVKCIPGTFVLPGYKMDKNLQSPSHLTEFAPLSPEPSQPSVGFLLSKFFRFNKGKTHSVEHLKIIMQCFFNR
jgi:hypothetical protein